jgi:hypothetical protein
VFGSGFEVWGVAGPAQVEAIKLISPLDWSAGRLPEIALHPHHDAGVMWRCCAPKNTNKFFMKKSGIW